MKSNKDDLEVKRLKIDEIQTESAMNGSSERTTDYSNSSVESPSTKREILVKTKISASAGQLEFEWIEGTDKDNLNQLVQYFRNILKSV